MMSLRVRAGPQLVDCRLPANADGQHVPNVRRQCLYLPLSGHAGGTAALDALNS